jgi:hypothetical protein
VLAVARQERAAAVGRLFVWLLRVVALIRGRLAERPLDSAALVR